MLVLLGDSPLRPKKNGMLDRCYIARAGRDFTAGDELEYNRIMGKVWQNER